MTSTYLNILLALARRRFDIFRKIIQATPALQADKPSILQDKVLKELERVRNEARFEALNEVLHDTMRLDGDAQYIEGVLDVEKIVTKHLAQLEKTLAEPVDPLGSEL